MPLTKSLGVRILFGESNSFTWSREPFRLTSRNGGLARVGQDGAILLLSSAVQENAKAETERPPQRRYRLIFRFSGVPCAFV
jgi:hypothetical protein